MDRPLAHALIFAAVVHASVLAFTHQPERAPAVVEAPAVTVEVIEPIDLGGPTGEPNQAGTPEVAKTAEAKKTVGITTSPPKVARSHEIVTAPSGTTTTESTPSSTVGEGSSTPPPTTEGSSKVASSGIPGAKSIPGLLDLDSPGKHSFIMPKSDAPTKEEAVAAKLDKSMKSALDAHDHDVGVGSGGPVASAAHSAAMGSKAPDTGRATFEVQTDGGGSIIAVRLVDSTGDPPGWQSVGTSLRAALAGQQLKVPSGAKGMLVKVLVEAAMRLPSGATQKVTIAPAGIGIGGKFDFSDVGAKPARVVAVRILEERRL